MRRRKLHRQRRGLRAAPSIRSKQTAIGDEIAPGDIVVMQGNLRAAATNACLRAAREKGARRCLNVSPIDTGGLPDCVWRTCWWSIEARREALAGTSDVEIGGSKRWRQRCGGTIVITLGAEGCLALDAGQAASASLAGATRRGASTQAAPAMCFAAALPAASAKGMQLHQALKLALAAAAVAVTRPGTLASCPSASEMAATHRSNGALMNQPSRPIGQSSGDALVQLFGRTKVVIGVVHLAPLPGAPRYDGEAVEAIYQRGLDDARAYLRWRLRRRDHREPRRHSLRQARRHRTGDIGLHGGGLRPYPPRARQADRHQRARQCRDPGLADRERRGAGFIRVNQWANAYVANEGFVEGESGRAARYRARLRANGIRIFADAHVKHGAHAIVADRAGRGTGQGSGLLRRRRHHRDRSAHRARRGSGLHPHDQGGRRTCRRWSAAA